MKFDQYLQQTQLFDLEERTAINAAFERHTIPKGEIVQEINRYSTRVLFIESGLLRIYYYQDGKEITHFFFDEDYFIVPASSILYHKSARYRWESLEPCTVKSISYEDFMKLQEQFPRFGRITFNFALSLLDLFSKKLNLLQFQTAYDKYNTFLEMYPKLNNRVSLGSIASFLGITQQTLSVIRSKKK